MKIKIYFLNTCEVVVLTDNHSMPARTLCNQANEKNKNLKRAILHKRKNSFYKKIFFLMGSQKVFP